MDNINNNKNEINFNNKLQPPSVYQAENNLVSPISSSDEDEENPQINEYEFHSNGYNILATMMTDVDINVKNIKLLDDREFLLEFPNIQIIININNLTNLSPSDEEDEIEEHVFYPNGYHILITTMPAENDVINTRILDVREFLIEFCGILIVITILDY